jgi:ech hydrogenase subunit C
MSYVTKSPWIIHYDGSSCNGCDIEVLACLTPMYDAERFGIINTGNPKHADIFLVTGSVNEQNISVVKQIYEQMPEPKIVVAVGICATSGGIFRECYNVKGGVDTVIPVDVYVPGCAARPEAIIDGIVKGLDVLAEKHANMPKSSVSASDAAEEKVKDEDMAIEVRYYGKTAEELDEDIADERVSDAQSVKYYSSSDKDADDSGDKNNGKEEV